MTHTTITSDSLVIRQALGIPLPTPLQTIATQIKALTWFEMELLCEAIDDAGDGVIKTHAPQLLNAAYALEAGE